MWILVIILSSGGVDHVEFSSEDLCKKAKSEMIAGPFTTPRDLYCVEK